MTFIKNLFVSETAKGFWGGYTFFFVLPLVIGNVIGTGDSLVEHLATAFIIYAFIFPFAYALMRNF